MVSSSHNLYCNEKDNPCPGAYASLRRLKTAYSLLSCVLLEGFEGGLGNRNNEVDYPKAQARSAHAVSIGMASLVCLAPRRCRGRRRTGILGMAGDCRTEMGVRQIYRPAEMALSAKGVLQ
jgi:hypothetical protein